MKLIENIEDIQILTEEKDGKQHLYIKCFSTVESRTVTVASILSPYWKKKSVVTTKSMFQKDVLLENLDTPMVLLSTLIVCLTASHH